MNRGFCCEPRGPFQRNRAAPAGQRLHRDDGHEAHRAVADRPALDEGRSRRPCGRRPGGARELLVIQAQTLAYREPDSFDVDVVQIWIDGHEVPDRPPPPPPPFKTDTRPIP